MKGFTLIETMVAITILTLSVAGPLYTASRAIVAAEIARDQLIASSLAQEGIECVRAVRDGAFLGAYRDQTSDVSGTGWADFIAASPYGECSAVVSPPFTRAITAVSISSTEARITSTVSWSFHSTSYSVKIIDHLTAWQ